MSMIDCEFYGGRDGLDYSEPTPCNLTKFEVEEYTESIRMQVGYRTNSLDIREVITNLGGDWDVLQGDDFNKSNYGSIVVHGPNDFNIYLPQHTSILKDNFTIAHELGHYFLHSDQGDIRIRANRFGTGRIEWEANWFAGSFLMPKEEIMRLYEEYTVKYDENTSILILSKDFDVSPSAVEVRLKRLKQP